MGSEDDRKKRLSPEQEALLKEGLRLVEMHAREMAPTLRMERDDLESAGREALLELVLEWQPETPFSFVATAGKRITWAMHREHRKQNPELERERVARRRREAKGEKEPEVTAQPVRPHEVVTPLQKAVVTFDPATDDAFPLELRDITTSLSAKVGRKLMVELILEAAAEYPEEERLLIVACVFEEISANELATRTGQHHSTVTRKLQRVTKKLRRLCKQRDITL